MTVQVEVVRVIVVPERGRTGQPRQTGPPALDARDPLTVEVGLEFGSAPTPAGGPVPRDQDHEGGGRPRHEQPGRLATSLGDEEPGANRGDCEDHKPELLVQSDRPGPLGRLPIEAAGAVRVQGGGAASHRLSSRPSRPASSLPPAVRG